MTDGTSADGDREAVLMAIEETWVDEHGHVHIELFGPANRFEDMGVPEESAILEVPSGEPRDWSLLEDASQEADRR